MRLALLALLLPIAAQAQTVLTPGSPDLTAAAPQSVEFDIRLAGDTPRTLGHFSRTETLDGDRLTIATHLTMPARNRDQRDTTVVSWPGLQPISSGFSDGEETYHVAYAGGRVAGRSVLGNLDERLDAALPAVAFGEGISWRIARSVPLRAGYTATFQEADKRGDLHAGTVTVGEQAGGAWPVTITLAGEPTTTHTVDAATRQVLHTASQRGAQTVEFAPPAPPPTGAVLRPGDPALDTSWLSTGETATFAMNLIEPMAMPVGTSTVTRSVAGGVVTSVQTITVPSQGMNETQTATADLATLRPLSQVNAGRQAVDLTFTDGQVSGTKAGAPLAVALDAPVFDSTWSNEIAQSLPLAAGYTTTAAVYDATNGVSTVTFTVTGQEDIGGMPAWTVEAATANGPFTYTIDAATRRLVRMRFSPQEGVVVEMTRQP